MRVFIDVTSACRSPQNTGMQRMTRKIFAELAEHAEVRPIVWNNIGSCYQKLGKPEHRFLERPFEVRSGATARPDWRGHDPITEFWRLINRPRIRLEGEVKAGDVFLAPDIYRDLRRNVLSSICRSHRRGRPPSCSFQICRTILFNGKSTFRPIRCSSNDSPCRHNFSAAANNVRWFFLA